MDTPNNTTPNTNVLMGVFSYLGPLVIVSYLTSKNDPFVKFHIKQGLVLLCIEVIVMFIAPMFLWQMWSLFQLINLLTMVLSIIGIVNVINKREAMLPVVGSLASYFKF